jgi:hypothetical protein
MSFQAHFEGEFDKAAADKTTPWLPTGVQVAGGHYKGYKIQPIEYIVANGIGFLAGNVIKYTTRYKDKGGAEDIRKAIHYLQMILQFEYKETK